MPYTSEANKPYEVHAFGRYYLTLFTVLYTLIGVLFWADPIDLFTGTAYHVLTDFVPRWCWAVMWLSCAAMMARPLYTCKPKHRTWACAAGAHACAVWACGTALALVIEPRSGAGAGPLFVGAIAILHYGVARSVRPDNPRFWGRTVTP